MRKVMYYSFLCAVFAILLSCGGGGTDLPIPETPGYISLHGPGTMYVGDTAQLLVMWYRGDGKEDVTGEVSWSTSNSNVATIHVGTLTAKAAGVATIRAEWKGHADKIEVTVVGKI